MNKLIETALPLAEMNDAAIRERAGKAGHPANLHMWWGRSPETSSLATLAAAVLDYSEETATADQELLAKAATDSTNALNAVRDRLSELGELPVVWDAFAGFGGIPIAAQKLGMRAEANDLNPVAAVLTRAAVDIPARFASWKPVHPGAAERLSYSGGEGLAEDIRFYGAWMENQALKRLSNVYPQMGNGEIPFAWLWVRTVKCPNPACNCHIPLSSSYVLQKAKTAQFWAEPVTEGGLVRFQIHEGPCPPGKESNKIGNNGARFRCPVCGEITTDEYIKKMGAVHGLGAEMMAVVTSTGGKKAFFAPDEVQRAAADVSPREDVPPGAIPANAHWFSPPSYGITEYADLFTPRQMRMLSTFSDLVREAQDMVASAALAAGMNESGGSLEDGGSGALAYGQAVGIYLAFVVDKMADYNSSMCSWRTAGGNTRSTFGRQAIPMVWTFAEGNPFSNVSGNFKTMLDSVAGSVERLGFGVQAVVTQDNALTMEYPKDVLVCTELPYYRDIGYADLSDFFYIWLRRSLKETYPQMFLPMVTPKDELSTASIYSGVSREDAEERYRTDMRAVCEKLYICSSSAYPALLFYCFRKNDLACIRNGGDGCNQSAWEFMLEGLLSAGFSITAVWPMRSEPASEKADSTRVLIVARKGVGRQGQITRRGFISTLKRELPDRLQRLWSGHVLPEDEFLSCMGQGLAVFSKYKTVLNADGSVMCVHDALQVIYLECEEHLALRNAAVSENAAETEEG